jgi:hypothetical protein
MHNPLENVSPYMRVCHTTPGKATLLRATGRHRELDATAPLSLAIRHLENLTWPRD